MDKRVFFILIGIIVLVGAVLGIRIMLSEDCEPPEITISPLTPEVGQAVTFTCTNADENISWDFGDQGKSSGKDASHVYKTNGSFTVKAAIGDCENTKEVVVIQKREMVRVTPSLVMPTEVHAGESITFSEVTPEVDSWKWTIKETNASSEGSSFTTSFGTMGTFTVSVSLRGKFVSGDTTFTVNVLKALPKQPDTKEIDKRKEEQRIAAEKKRQEALAIAAKNAEQNKIAEKERKAEAARLAKEKRDEALAAKAAKDAAANAAKAAETRKFISDDEFKQKFVSIANDLHDDENASAGWKDYIVGATGDAGSMLVTIQGSDKPIKLESFKNIQITSSTPYKVAGVTKITRGPKNNIVAITIIAKK